MSVTLQTTTGVVERWLTNVRKMKDRGGNREGETARWKNEEMEFKGQEREERVAVIPASTGF